MFFAASGSGNFTWFVVEASDADRVAEHLWFAKKVRSVEHDYFVISTRIAGKGVLLSRFLLGMNPGERLIADHRNRNTLDHRRLNLRPVNTRSSVLNRRLPKNKRTSVYRGVAWNTRVRKWMAFISIRGHNVLLEYFDSEEAAARMYDRMAIAYWGADAQPNFPGETVIKG